jgi:hypothetical protein
MLILANEQEQMEWDLKYLSSKIKVSNWNKEPIMKVKVLGIAESLKLAAVCIECPLQNT